MEEPCCKKQKIDKPKENFQIKAILPDDLINPICTEKVIITTVAQKQLISSIMLELSRCLPLSSLQHLKRVRQNQIILCKKCDLPCLGTTDVSVGDDVKEHIIAQGVPNKMALQLCENLSEVEVASIAPKLRWQYEAVNQLWPCKFHPSRYLESLSAGTNFSKPEASFHCRILSVVQQLSVQDKKPIGICVDPRSNSIVCIAMSRIDENPLMHCPMVLVDFVARSQNAGAWKYGTEEFHESPNEKLNYRGIPEIFFQAIIGSMNVDVNFGAENVKLQECTVKIPEEVQSENNLVKYGPYLCTGYDVYFSSEPCLMCAMALLHSRTRRIFYIKTSANGALQTLIKLHTIKDLNHHYEVYHCSSDTKTDQ